MKGLVQILDEMNQELERLGALGVRSLPGITFHTVDAAAFIQDAWRPSQRLTINYGVRYDYRFNPDRIAPNPDIPETLSINSGGGVGPRIGISGRSARRRQDDRPGVNGV